MQLFLEPHFADSIYTPLQYCSSQIQRHRERLGIIVNALIASLVILRLTGSMISSICMGYRDKCLCGVPNCVDHYINHIHRHTCRFYIFGSNKDYSLNIHLHICRLYIWGSHKSEGFPKPAHFGLDQLGKFPLHPL